MFDFSLNQLRTIQTSLMPVSATVRRSVQGGTNEMGEPIVTPTSFSLPCRINASNGTQELRIAEILGVLQPFTISYPATINLMTTDVIEANGAKYEVLGLVEAQTFETFHRAICKQTR